MAVTPPTDADVAGTPLAVTFKFGGQTNLSGLLMGRSKDNLGGNATCVQYAVDYYPASTGNVLTPTRLNLTDANDVSK